MKHVILFLIFVGCSLSVFSQQRSYSYDAAGNRISRYTVTLRSSLQHIDSLSQELQIEKEGISRSLLTCEVVIFPNPTQGEVNISISKGEEDAVSEITVLSNSGQLLMTREGRGNTTLSIDLSEYTSGIYLINFRQGDNTSYYKIIKQ